MAGLFDAAVDDIAAGEEKAARAAQPGSTLTPPPGAPAAPPVAQNPADVLPGLPANDAGPGPSPATGGASQTASPPDALAPPPKPGLFDAAVNEIASDDATRFQGALEMARKTDPVRYTEAADIAARDGLPLDFVQQNLDDLKSRAVSNDMRKALEANPRLKNWFLTGDNANTVKLDDLHKLSGLNWLYEASAANWQEGWQQRQSADVRYRQIFGRATEDEIKAADKADREDKRDYGVEGFFQGAIPGLAQQLPNMLGGFYEGIKKAPYAATLGTAAGAAVGSMAGGVGAAPGAVAGFGSGVAAGMIQGRAIDSFRQEAGGAYSEFLQIRGDSGERVDPDVAKGAALIAGVANSALETIGEAALEKLVPGLDKFGVGALLKQGSREVLKEAIKRPTLAAAIKSFSANVLRGGATEVGTEVAQEAITIMARIAAEKNSAGEFQPMEPAEIGSRLLETAEQTAQAMLVLTPALASPRFGRDLSNWRRSEEMRSVYEGANQAAAETELRTTAPARYLDAVKSFLQDGKASDTVYVPAEKMTELFQSMDLTAADLDARIDGFSQRYAEALATGGDVHIPMADYQTHIAGTPLGEALIEHQRWNPEMATVSEAREALAQAREQQDAILQEALDASKADAERAAPRQRVERAVYDMLVNIGESPDTARAQARLQAAFFDTTGQRAGVDPYELFQRQGLDIRRAMPDGLDYRRTDELDLALDAVRRGDGDRAARMRLRGQGPSLGAFLANQGGLNESDAFAGELRARDLKDRNGGRLLGKPGRGLDLDTASLRAAEAGYFPSAVNEDGTVNRDGLVDALLSALDEEGAGRNLYAIHPDDVQIDPQLARVESLSREMAQLGLDPASTSNDEIRAELLKATSPNATEGALFQFAGPKAVAGTPAGSQERSLLARARDMAATGAYPDEIFAETGFFKGVDGKWRIEIEDTGAKLDLSRFVEHPDGGDDFRGPLHQVLDHPGLFAAYPALRDMPVEIGLGGDTNSGFYQPNDLYIKVDAKDEVSARSVLLHEIAHAIQHIEGFAFGGNPRMGEIYEGEAVREILSLIEKNKEQQTTVAKAYDKGAPIDKAVELMGELMNREQSLQERLKEAAGYEYYQRIAGEVEARNVQERDRRRLAGEELDMAKWTEDVAQGDQIVIAYTPRKNVAFSAMSAEPTREMREFFQAAGTGDKRGSIQFQGDRTVINLFQAANLSTFLHESGHLFLEVSKQVAEAADAPDAVKADWRTLLDFIGAKEGEAIKRDAHEKFAKAFETYLSEGKAPSDELRGVFERFKSWLMYVYRGAARAMGLPAIPAEIRDVFDRMLATEQEIAEVARDPAVRPMFKDAADAGLTDAQWARMVKAAEAATDAAKGQLLAQMIGERTRETTRQWKEQKEAARQEVYDELSTRPVYQAQHYIRTGEVLNSDQVAPVGLDERRLDRAWLVQRYGKDVLTRLPKIGGRLQYVEKGGISPDEMAEWFGFTSGEHMVNEMMSAVPFPRAVVQRTDELMRERNGDLLNDQRAAAEAAAQAFHNDLRGPVLEMELAALAGKAKLKAGLTSGALKAYRDMARDMIRSKKVNEATRVGAFSAARDKAARQAEAAMLKGDYAAAVNFKRQQIINHNLTIQAQMAREEAENTRRYLDKFSDRKRPGGVDPEYLDQIEGILERFEFKKATSLPAIERRKSLAQFLEEATARGDAILVPQDLTDKAQLVSYKDMTMEDLSALRDVVKNVEHLGRLKNRLLEKGRLVAFTATRDELVAQAVKTPPKAKQKYRNATAWDRFKNGVEGVDAYLLKMEQVFQWLDLGDVNGPFTRVIFQKFVDAQNRKGEMQVQVATKLKEIMDGLDPGYLNERKAVPLRPELSFLRSELYAIALNQGTESNREKILKGELSAKNSFRGEDEMNSALSLLTKEDWDRVQAMWDVLEGFWPETAALEKRLTGVEPPKLERRKVQTAFGEYNGGYYPIVYDPAQAFDVMQRSDKELDAQFDNSTFSRPAVAHGFTKARVDNYSRPILLDLRALTGHIDKAIQNITHREPVRDTLKLISDPELQRTLIETMGRPVYQEMYKWLDRIAKDRGEPPANASIARLMSGARANISLYAMGFRLTTALSQLAGWSNAMEMVKPSHMGSALAATIRHPQETWATITAKSGEMRDRTNNLDRDVRAALARLEGKTRPVDTFKKFAFWGTAMADRAVAAPTWLGAYNQHLATYPTDEAGAIRAGDRAVRLTQGSGAPKDLSSIMGNKNEALQVYTMFYSYFNLYYNRLRALGRDTRIMMRDGEYEDIPHLLARSVFLVILPAIMADALVGKWKDDDEGWAWWAFRKASLYPMMSLPLVRDIGGALDSGLAYQMSPLARFGELATRLVQDGNKLARGEDVEGRLMAKRAAELAGYTFGLPLGQGVGTVSNVWQGLEQNDFKTRDLLFSRRAFGDTRDQ